MNIRATGADTFIGHAGEICFAAATDREARVQHVIPEIQFGNRRRIYEGYEVNRVMSHIHEDLVSSNTVERRNLVVGNSGGVHVQAETGMRETDCGALCFRPLRYWQCPAWPVFDLLRAGVILAFEPNQHE